MSTIIKSGEVADHPFVRPLPLLSPVCSQPIVSPVETEREALRKRIAALETEIRDRDEAIEKSRSDVEQARADGYVEGHSDGLAQASDRAAERLEQLGKTLAAAQESLRGSLGVLERLAPLLARECLDKMLANPEYRQEVVTQLIAAQLATIDKNVLLLIDVALADFPEDQLAALAARQNLERVQLRATSDLTTGQCVMRLRLGEIDIGLEQQWDALRAILDELGGAVS